MAGLPALTSLHTFVIESAIEGTRRERKRRAKIERLFRHAPRCIPPRKVSVHPVSKVGQSQQLFEGDENDLLTRTIKAPACGDVKHGPCDGKQNPPAVVATILCERARSKSLEEQRRSVGTGFP